MADRTGSSHLRQRNKTGLANWAEPAHAIKTADQRRGSPEILLYQAEPSELFW